MIARDPSRALISPSYIRPGATSATMVLELHVWGPAFSLPSIEAQSLATIAYFVLAVPKDEWVLVPSSDPSVSPTSKCLEFDCLLDF